MWLIVIKIIIGKLLIAYKRDQSWSRIRNLAVMASIYLSFTAIISSILPPAPVCPLPPISCPLALRSYSSRSALRSITSALRLIISILSINSAPPLAPPDDFALLRLLYYNILSIIWASLSLAGTSWPARLILYSLSQSTTATLFAFCWVFAAGMLTDLCTIDDCFFFF